MNKEMPDEVYVQRYHWEYGPEQNIEDDDYLIVSETKDDLFDQDLGHNQAGVVVGIYKLQRVVEMTKTIRQPLYKERPVSVAKKIKK
jgi:type IV secretory pathway VirB9-like protein